MKIKRKAAILAMLLAAMFIFSASLACAQEEITDEESNQNHHNKYQSYLGLTYRYSFPFIVHNSSFLNKLSKIQFLKTPRQL